MAADGMQLVGDKELNKLLLRLPEKMLGDVMKKTVTSGARKIRTTARKRIEVTDAVETGLLKKSLSTKTRLSKRLGTVRARVWPKKLVQGVGPRGRKRVPYYYAHLVEFGHRIVNAWGSHGHVPARPFLRPALDENRTRITSEFDGKARKFLDKAIAKAEAQRKT
jgi:HK97 gp10 family phage protein